MILLWHIKTNYDTIIRYYFAIIFPIYDTWDYYFSYYIPYYDTLFLIIFPIIFNYNRGSAPEKWEHADSNSWPIRLEMTG